MRLTEDNNVENFSFSSLSACQAARAISKSYAFLATLSIELILSTIAVTANVTLVLLMFRNQTLHINLRILLGHTTICIIWYCTGYGVKAVYVLIMLTVAPCQLNTEAFRCKIQEMLSVTIPYLNVNYSLLAIGLERFYATMTYRSYERSRNVAPSIILLIGLWTVVMCQQLVPAMSIEKGSKVMPVCINLLSISESTARTVITIMLIVALLSLALIMINLKLNSLKLNSVYINRTQQNLSARFQLDQNFKTTRAVLPVVVAQIICSLPQSVFLSVLFYTDYFLWSPEDKIHYINVPFIFNIAFGITFAVVTFARNPAVKKGLKKYFPGIYKLFDPLRFKRKREMFNVKVGAIIGEDNHNCDSTTEKYFINLDSLWAKNFKDVQEKFAC